MQAPTLIFMVLVLGVLWGGFAALLAHSMKSEKARAAGRVDQLPTGGNSD